MITVTLRTDKPQAELSMYDGQTQIAHFAWEAHRELAETIHMKLSELLKQTSKMLHEVNAFVVYSGPGSFTGLRIGISVANAYADALETPIVGTSGDDWVQIGIAKLMDGESDGVVMPEYGALPNVSTPKKT